MTKDVFSIRGGIPLKGQLTIDGSKNSAVALIPALILGDEPVVLKDVPNIADTKTLFAILRELGGIVTQLSAGVFEIDPRPMVAMPLPEGNVKKLRASYYLMGAMLGRFHEAVVGLPGGCYLGPRPIDQHVKGFEALGARVTNEQGAIYLRAEHLEGARIYLDTASVGATINLMLAAVKADGQTVIENAAMEPEIVDVASLLNQMGGRIIGAGTNRIRIIGVPRLHGCEHTVIPDRIEAGTYLIMAAATNGDVRLNNVIAEHLEPVVAKLRESGVQIERGEDFISVHPRKAPLKAVDIQAMAYPGFPTDLQQPFLTLLTQVEGTALVTDTIYSARFKQVDELKRMGAVINVEGRTAIVRSSQRLSGAIVTASDLRAGAALVTAGLMADGVTVVQEIAHIERGYAHIVEKLSGLGADIERIPF
ncbi:UDP-N-acetylglucosamine 1-carboxyvinyltransferase [Brochothrix campestris]|uniref:UDP-N-acetylglucosamine 1-carboxyvinyltransferase n=1 Tax=Brochothrix campestris FSL F6-1037 TaxID=1265861 RepID=W7CWC6_9LIST|nr:UDP-N-acetylglucosamine 1-carboxyvinyltransferase [Brochothrix campestris]EUJ40066.1 UDP-N-acetylglucosamine 1-carboxyvinyltransferase [Brochothrix campestris FSL F6-1037]